MRFALFRLLQLRCLARLSLLGWRLRYSARKPGAAAASVRLPANHGAQQRLTAGLLVVIVATYCQSQSTGVKSTAKSEPVSDHPTSVSASFEDPNLPLSEGKSEGEPTVWVRIKNLAPNSPLTSVVPKVEDHSAQSGDLKVKFTCPTGKGQTNSDSVEWQCKAVVVGLPLRSTLKRTAVIYLGNSRIGQVDYTLTNVGQGTFTWSVKGPPDQWVLAANPEVSLVVITGDRQARNVRLVQLSLQDPSTKRQIGLKDLILCEQNDSGCQQEAFKRCGSLSSSSSNTAPNQEASAAITGSPASAINIPPRHASPLSLSVCPNFSNVGVFAGSISLGTDEDASTQAVNLTVLASSRCTRITGFLAMVAGLALWIFSTLILRRSFNRNQLLLPFAELHDTLVNLRAAVLKAQSRAGAKFDSILSQLSALDAKLTAKNLSDVIPSSLPSILSNDPAVSATYQQRLAELTEKVAAQSVLVQGISSVLRNWSDDPAAQTHLFTALESLDNLDLPGTPVVTQADAQLKVAVILKTMTAALAPALGGAPIDRPLPTSREIQISSQRLNYVAWSVWIVLTLAVGYFVLIASYPGFGTWVDLWKCFFWGVGMPIAGQQLQQLNPTSVSNALSFSIPKT
jgi:hypothetical protein